jgi:hypothetical protein
MALGTDGSVTIRQLTHVGTSFDSVRIGDGTDVWSIDGDKYGEVSIRKLNIDSQNVDLKITLDGEVVSTKSAPKIWTTNSADVAKAATDQTITTFTPTGADKTVYRVKVAADGCFLFKVLVGVAAAEVLQDVTRVSSATPKDECVLDVNVPNGQQCIITASNEDNKAGNIKAYCSILHD